MRRLFVLFVLVSCLMLSACSEDPNFLGTWVQEGENNPSITFYPDGTYKMEIVWAIVSGKYEQNGNTATLEVGNGKSSDPIIVTIENGKMRFGGNDAVFVKTRAELKGE